MAKLRPRNVVEATASGIVEDYEREVYGRLPKNILG
jgi:hypothetical protein